MLVLGAVAVAGVRIWATWWARAPVVVADESVFLAVGRFLGGNGNWHIGSAATQPPAYSLLIAPWSALGLTPSASYRAAIVTNVALAVVGYLVLERLVLRLTRLVRPWSCVAALVGTATPGLVINAAYAWSDPMAVTAFLLLALAAVAVIDVPSPSRVAALVAAALLAYGTHGRFVPASLVVGGLLIGLAWTRPDARRALLAGMVGLGAGLVAIDVASGAIHDRLYSPGGQIRQTTNDLGRVLDVGPMALTAAGQSWYVLVTTAGLAGFGALALVFGDGRGRSDGRAASPRTAHWVVAAMVAITMLTSIGFMSRGDRPDKLIYGRYNDVVVGLLIALGAARLTGLSTRRRLVEGFGVVVTIVATGVLVGLVRADELDGAYNGYTIRSLLAFGTVRPQDVLAVTVAGALVAAVVLAATFVGSREVVLLVVLGLATFGTIRGVLPVRVSRPGDVRSAAQLQQIVPEGDLVAYAAEADDLGQPFFRYPFYAPNMRLRQVGGDVWANRPRWVMAPRDEPAPSSYRLVWTDPVLDRSLWHLDP